MMNLKPDPVLRVNGLVTEFYGDRGNVRAVDGVSFEILCGETLCIVGESGSGKSALVQSIMQLIPKNAGQIPEGSVRLAEGRNLLELDENEMSDIRGSIISMIFQEPMTSLNPLMRIGDQIAETIIRHENVGRKAARERAGELLDKVRIPNLAEAIDKYPHELSGGMRQRVMVAIAIACNPRVILADEPTTALDVTTQARVLQLLKMLQEELGSGLVLITHDLGVARRMADHVCVMYAGQIVEQGTASEVLDTPAHPYTRKLLASRPGAKRYRTGERLTAIEGSVPDLTSLPKGCRFQNRCDRVHDRCREMEPHLFDTFPFDGDSHRSRCWLVEEEAQDAL